MTVSTPRSQVGCGLLETARCSSSSYAALAQARYPWVASTRASTSTSVQMITEDATICLCARTQKGRTGVAFVPASTRTKFQANRRTCRTKETAQRVAMISTNVKRTVHAMRLCLVPTPADPSSAGSAHSKKPTAPTCRPEHSTGSRRSLEMERSSVWTLMSVRTTMVAVTCSPPAQTRSGASSVESAQQSIRVRYRMGTTHSLFLTMATDSQAASMWTNVVCRLLTRPMAVATR